MRIISSDYERSVDIGTSDIWHSLYSIVETRSKNFKKSIPLALSFLKTGNSGAENALECARQFNLIRDELSKYPPQMAVYDIDDVTKSAPWADNISPVVTSCGNLYLTADGKDLLYEIVSILTYAYYAEVSLLVE